MKTVLVFGGTSEGRRLAEELALLPVRCVVCVATDYGEAALGPGTAAALHKGRLDAPQMRQLMRREGAALVIDATHPYAGAVSGNIQKACQAQDIPYWRLVRAEAELPPDGCEYFDRVEDLVQRLGQLPGNILLTTGSKDLAAFTKVEGYRERIYPRILPAVDSLEQCTRLGYDPRHILCMQGPFSQRFNEALIQELDIKVLVTKESGRAGGFYEKAAAAQARGIPLLVLGRPLQEQGMSLPEVLAALRRQFGTER